MAIIFPEYEHPAEIEKLDISIASMIQTAHETSEAIGLLDLAVRIRCHVIRERNELDELCSISPIYTRPKSITPREWLARFKAEGGVLPKPRIRITAAMQRANQM